MQTTQLFNISVKAIAHEVRKELRAAFKGVKFTVTWVEHDIDSLLIEWNDGPIEAKVISLVSKYQGIDYSDNGTTEKVIEWNENKAKSNLAFIRTTRKITSSKSIEDYKNFIDHLVVNNRYSEIKSFEDWLIG